MRVIMTARAFSDGLEAERARGRRVGLVPAGSPDAGHRSLEARAAAERDVVAVTVFVNPLQFTVAEDLAPYPRDLPGDVPQATAAGATLVFAPPVQEMYSGFPAPVATSVHVDAAGHGSAGVARPVHFDGGHGGGQTVLPGRPQPRHFGEKDIQQLAVVRRGADLSLPVDIVACPTVREESGLALSSRNVRCRPRAARPPWPCTCSHAGVAALDAGERDPGRPSAVMRDVLEATVWGRPRLPRRRGRRHSTTPSRLSGEVRLLVAAPAARRA